MPMHEVNVTNGEEETKKPKRPLHLKTRGEPKEPPLPNLTIPLPEQDPYATATPEENAKLNVAKGLTPTGGTVEGFIRRRDDQGIRDWLAQLGDKPNLRVHLHRRKPDHILAANGERIKTDGFCQSFTEIVTEEDIARLFGGGEYELRIQTPDARGNGMKMRGSTIVQIQGEPKPPTNPTTKAHDEVSNPFVTKTMALIDEGRQRAEEELRQLRASGGAGNAQMTRLFEMQLEQAREDKRAVEARLNAAQQELRDAINRPPQTDPMRDKIFEKMVDGADSRLTAVKQQHESEIRVLKESHQQEIRMLRDGNERDKEHLIRAHERSIDDLRSSTTREITNMQAGFTREISNLKAVHEASFIATKSSGDLATQMLQREVDTLRVTVSELRVENKDLRAKANPSIAEKVAEINALKEIVSPSDGEEAAPWYVTFANAAASTPHGQAVLNRVMGAIDTTPTPQQQALPAATQQAAAHQQPAKPRRIRDKRTGQVMLRHANGQVTPLVHKAPDGTAEPVWAIPPEQVIQAVRSLEMACANKVAPDVFAVGARNYIPAEIMEAIRREGGVDVAIDKMAELEQASILRTQDGRNWLRKVSKAILGN